MSRRRSFMTFDWYGDHDALWLVRADAWHYPLKIIHLPRGSDLVVAFLQEALAVHSEGWRLRELTMTFGSFVAYRPTGKEILHVSFQSDDPATRQRKPMQL